MKKPAIEVGEIEHGKAYNVTRSFKGEAAIPKGNYYRQYFITIPFRRTGEDWYALNLSISENENRIHIEHYDDQCLPEIYEEFDEEKYEVEINKLAEFLIQKSGGEASLLALPRATIHLCNKCGLYSDGAKNELFRETQAGWACRNCGRAEAEA